MARIWPTAVDGLGSEEEQGRPESHDKSLHNEREEVLRLADLGVGGSPMEIVATLFDLAVIGGSAEFVETEREKEQRCKCGEEGCSDYGSPNTLGRVPCDENENRSERESR